jgi:hypothetical protein
MPSHLLGTALISKELPLPLSWVPRISSQQKARRKSGEALGTWHKLGAITTLSIVCCLGTWISSLVLGNEPARFQTLYHVK